MADTRHHTGSADVLLILVVGAPIAGALIGGGVGLLLSWPDPFVLFIASTGVLVGAFSGLASACAGLGTHYVTRRLSADAVRCGIVSVLAGAGAAATVWGLLNHDGVLGVGALAAAAFGIGGIAAAISYPRLHRHGCVVAE
jgi:hypothetical protein